jgi:predicted transglutaminase-like cysteine proteinase
MTSSVVALADGRAGILQTAGAMRELVNDYKKTLTIRNLALHLVQNLPAKDQLSEVEALFTFVQSSIRYVKDIYGVETLSSPDRTLESGQGDCDDQAVLLASLLEAIGYQTCFKLAGYSSTDFQHVYTCVFVNGDLINLDTTEPQPMGWEPPGALSSAYIE